MSCGFNLCLSLVLAVVSVKGMPGARRTLALAAGQDSTQAQPQETADAATKLLRDGRDLIRRESWARAAAVLGEFLAAYPNHKNADAALYWLALSLQKQGKYAEATRQVERLRNEFPRSSWTNEGLSLRLEAAAVLGDERVLEEAVNQYDGELKLIALQYLFQDDPARAMTYAADILKLTSTASPRVRRSTVIMVGQYGGGGATTLLLDIGARQTDPALRRSAVAALGRTGNERALQVLGELAATSEDKEMVRAALFAISQYGNDRAHALLVELARTAPAPATRQEAVLRLSQKGGTAASDELLKLYDAERDVTVRGRIIEVMSQPGAERVQSVESLIRLYDSEQGVPLKARILLSLGGSREKKAVQKLMVVAVGDAAAELRNRALVVLAQSDDPEAARFLKRQVKRP